MPDPIDKLSAELGAALKSRGWMVATAESCTGGGVGEAITRTAGSSAWFDRGFITYTNEAKQELLGVRAETLQTFGAVSEQTALEMARGALAASRAHVAVAVSGIAGPGGATKTKPLGTVCLAWAGCGRETRCRTEHFTGDREAVRRQAVFAALQGVLDFLRAES